MSVNDISVLQANDFRITLSQVRVASNAILSFVLKEVCPEKISEKNTYIVKVQGIEMNNLTNVEKVKIEEGVWHFSVNLCPIRDALIDGIVCDTSANGPNVLEVDGTANMFVAGSGNYDGFYTLSCIGDFLSIYSNNGISLIDNSCKELTGFYKRVVKGSGDKRNVRYERVSGKNKYIIFFYTKQNKWYIKQIVKNGKTSNIILYQQSGKGTFNEAPLKNWTPYVNPSLRQVCGLDASKLCLRPCIPFAENISNLILVNCGGYDRANGCYYKDELNNRYINVRDPNLRIKYVTDPETNISRWVIVDFMVDNNNFDELEVYRSPEIKNGTEPSCVPCCDWEKICETPEDPPQVVALEYYNITNPSQTISYVDGWSLFDGFDVVATGVSDNYIVVRSTGVTPEINGAYCLTCVQNNSPEYTKILDTNVRLVYNGTVWEIKQDGGPVLFTSSGTNPDVPPFDGWIRVGPGSGISPLVLNAILPSSVNWTLL